MCIARNCWLVQICWFQQPETATVRCSGSGLASLSRTYRQAGSFRDKATESNILFTIMSFISDITYDCHRALLISKASPGIRMVLLSFHQAAFQATSTAHRDCCNELFSPYLGITICICPLCILITSVVSPHHEQNWIECSSLEHKHREGNYVVKCCSSDGRNM